MKRIPDLPDKLLVKIKKTMAEKKGDQGIDTKRL